MEGFGGREGSEAVLNELIGVCDLAVYIECTGAMRQKPDNFLLDGVVKALKWRNEIDLIGIGAGFRSPPSTAQTAHLRGRETGLSPSSSAVVLMSLRNPHQ